MICPAGHRVIPSTGDHYTMREVAPGQYAYHVGACEELVSLSCDECPPDTGSRLFVTVAGRRFCARHWHAAGCPTPRGPLATAQEVHEAELRTRERMTARGSADRQAVRSGRT